MSEQKRTCSYHGCTETENLYDLTPFNAPEQEFSACEEHYDLVAHELLDDGYVLDSPTGHDIE